MSHSVRSPISAPEADRPRFDGPVSTVLIAHTPRSGSTLLAWALGDTGLCGVPHEYLNFVHMRDFRTRIGDLPVPSLMAWLKLHRTTPNGVFCIKASAHQIQHEVLEQNLPLRPLFAPLRCVWIQRADKVRQAVSYTRAVQTDRWNSEAEARQEAHYDYDHIERSLRFILIQTRNWPKLFGMLGVSPIQVQYQQLIRHYEATVRSVVGALGLAAPMDVSIAPPRQKRMPNLHSREWCTRFRAEATSKGVNPRLFGPEEPWT